MRSLASLKISLLSNPRAITCCKRPGASNLGWRGVVWFIFSWHVFRLFYSFCLDFWEGGFFCGRGKALRFIRMFPGSRFLYGALQHNVRLINDFLRRKERLNGCHIYPSRITLLQVGHPRKGTFVSLFSFSDS